MKHFNTKRLQLLRFEYNNGPNLLKDKTYQASSQKLTNIISPCILYNIISTCTLYNIISTYTLYNIIYMYLIQYDIYMYLIQYYILLYRGKEEIHSEIELTIY